MRPELEEIQAGYVEALGQYLSVHAARNQAIREAIHGGTSEKEVMEICELGLGELGIILTGDDKHTLP